MAFSTADLVHFFLEHVPGACRTQIVEFLYLADMEARRYLGKPISGLNYVWHDHGPFDRSVLACLDKLEAQGKVRDNPANYSSAVIGHRYYSQQAPGPRSWQLPEQTILDHVARTYGGMDLETLLDEVHRTKPMADAKERGAFNQPLRMDMVNNEAVIPGLELPRVLGAIANLDAGQGKSHDAVFAGLRAQTVAKS